MRFYREGFGSVNTRVMVHFPLLEMRFHTTRSNLKTRILKKIKNKTRGESLASRYWSKRVGCYELYASIEFFVLLWNFLPNSEYQSFWSTVNLEGSYLHINLLCSWKTYAFLLRCSTETWSNSNNNLLLYLDSKPVVLILSLWFYKKSKYEIKKLIN